MDTVIYTTAGVALGAFIVTITAMVIFPLETLQFVANHF